MEELVTTTVPDAGDTAKVEEAAATTTLEVWCATQATAHVEELVTTILPDAGGEVEETAATATLEAWCATQGIHSVPPTAARPEGGYPPRAEQLVATRALGSTATALVEELITTTWPDAGVEVVVACSSLVLSDMVMEPATRWRCWQNLLWA